MKFLILLLIIISPAFSFSQAYVEKMQNRTTNISDAQKLFNNYWEGKKIERGKGYKAFKRWEHFWYQRNFPSGYFSDPSLPYKEIEKLQKADVNKRNELGTWQFIGPNVVPTGGGAGRLNFIEFVPGVASSFYVGAPAGGLWKTLNSGASWSSNTDRLAVLGMSDLIIDPVNPSIMYVATGDVDASTNYSVGVLKSTNGGQSWGQTGLSFEVTSTSLVSKLIISPADHLTLYAATDNGLFKTTNGGHTWNKIKTGNFRDVEFKPGDPNTVYAVTNRFYKSTNGGSTFLQINNGLTLTSAQRITIAVTPANANNVYLLASSNTYSDFLGLWLSQDSGNSFSQQSSTPNLLGYDVFGQDQAGQGWYDLSLAVSPVNENIVFVGGVNVWKSTNKGVDWDISSHWYGANSVPYVHADIHAIEFAPGSGSTVYVCSDGGLFKSSNTGSTWTDISSNLQISQIYRIGMNVNNDQHFIFGTQDNGSNLFESGQWQNVLGGDGMECAISSSNSNTVFGSLYNGTLYRSTNGGYNFDEITSSILSSEQGAWVTPFVLSPTNQQIMFAGFNNVWKSTNSGTTWTKISNNTGSNLINCLAVAPSNNAYIYYSSTSSLSKTTDGGTTWVNISTNQITNYITSITVHPTNPSRIWVTCSGYDTGKKIFYSADAGTTWQNISLNLPNVPANCLAYDKNSNDAIYIGTDIGIFYTNASLTEWLPYNGGFPNVIVNDLEILYNYSKIRAATYGRGIWESPLFNFNSAVPLVDFVSDKTSECVGASVNFTDNSGFNPTAWSWSFDGGTPSVSNVQNPTVTYNSPGDFNVSLIATNQYGQATTTKSAMIHIKSKSVPYTEDFELVNASINNFKLQSNLFSNVFLVDNDDSNNGFFMVLEGVVSGVTQFVDASTDSVYAKNPEYIAGASLCLQNYTAQSLYLTFDYKQQFEYANYYTNFRVLVNGNPVTEIIQPTGATTGWLNRVIDLSAFSGGDIEITFQSCNKSQYNHIVVNRGNATLIDNINLQTTLSKEKMQIPGKLAISPNPIIGNCVKFNYFGIEQWADYSIVNSLGEVVDKGVVYLKNAENKIIKTLDLPVGIYSIVFKNETFRLHQKFIKL